MPRIQVTGGNQPPLPDGQLDFGGGQNSFMPAHRLAPNECQRMLNCDILRLGDIVTRRGTRVLGWPAASPITGLGYYDVGETEKLIRVSLGEVAQHSANPAHVWQPISGWSPTSEQPCVVVQGNNRLFLSNGEGIRVWDGTGSIQAMQSDYPDALPCPYLIYATNRLIAAGNTAFPDTVWFSNFLQEDKWSGQSSLRVGAGDGDPITGLTLWTDTLLVVFKRSSVYLVDIAPALAVSEFTVKLASPSIGCVGSRAFAKVGKDLWFYSDHGLRSLARVLEGQDTEVSPAISFPISDVLARVDRQRTSCAAAHFYNDVFFLALPVVSEHSQSGGGLAGTPSSGNWGTLLPVRLVAGAAKWLGEWSGAWDAHGVSQFARSYAGGQAQLNFAVGDKVYQWLDTVPEHDESINDYRDGPTGTYPTEITTRAMSFGDESLWKQGFSLEAEFNRSRGRVDLYTLRDGGLDAEAILTADSGLPEGLSFPFAFPFTFAPAWERIKRHTTLMHCPRFRELAIRIRASSGKLALRKIQATAFAGSMDVRSQD